MPAVSKAQLKLFAARCKEGDKKACKLLEENKVSGKAYKKLPEKKTKK